jgi:acetylornithine deacetylase/succinyl-diaminopimelate desuccinylase-like protein
MDTSPSPDLEGIFTYIDKNEQAFLARLIDYLRHPSISAYGEGIAETANYIADVMRHVGLAVRVMPTSGWPMVLGEYSARPGAPTVLLYGHYDVQPPEPLEEWLSPPFEPTIRAARLYARGVGDNKGQHFAQLLALETLLACQGTLPCNVKFLLEGEEEVGSPHMPEFVQAHCDELQADLVIISDGPVHESGQSIISIDEIQRSLDLQHLDEPRERGYFERLAAWPTLTINGIHGGYGGPGSKTVLPHEAIARCDIRLVEAQTGVEILEKVRAHVQRHAPEVSVTSYGSMDPSKTPLDSRFTEPLLLAITAAQGRAPLLSPAMGGSLPNYAFTKTLGIPAFGIPYANADESNHAPNENMEVARFFMGIKTGAAMLTYLERLVS